MDAAKETELLSAVTDIGGDTDCILQMLRSVKEHHKEENTMDSNLAAALLANQNNRYNNGFDSPWMYLIWLAMFANRGCGGLFGGGDCGQGAAAVVSQELGNLKGILQGDSMTLQRLASDMASLGLNQNFNKDTLLTAIRNNTDQLCQCCSQLQMALCTNEKETLNRLYNMEVTALQNTNMLSSKIDQCCCQTNLNIERTGNNIERLIDRTSCNTDKEILGLGTAMNSQFAQVQFNNQLQTNSILAAVAAEGDKTRDLMRQQKFDEVVRERDLAYAQLSQNAQTNNLREYMDVKLAQIFGQPYSGCCGPQYSRVGCGCNIPSAINPNGSQAYPFYVNNTQTTGTATA